MSVQPGTPPGDRQFRDRLTTGPQSARLSAPLPVARVLSDHEAADLLADEEIARLRTEATSARQERDVYRRVAAIACQERDDARAEADRLRPLEAEAKAAHGEATRLRADRDDARELNADVLDPVRWTEDPPYAVLRVSVDHLAAWRQQWQTEPKP